MRGTIYLANKPGRALRRKAQTVYMRDVLFCSGDFLPGEPVYIAFITFDGAQYAIATGIARCSGDHIRETIGPPRADASMVPRDSSDGSVLVLDRDVRRLWPPATPEP
jgi:hypothetical protein